MEAMENNMGKKLFHRNKNLPSRKQIGRHSEMRIYTTIIFVNLMNATEVMSMTMEKEKEVKIIKQRIMRMLLGIKRICGVCSKRFY